MNPCVFTGVSGLPPRYDRWPIAMRSAMLLRGALERCGPGVKGIAWPDLPLLRLTALAPWLAPGHMAALLSAAWVWGACETPGGVITIASRAGQHGRATPQGAHRFELRLRDGDALILGEFEVTSRRRTLYDLLFLSPVFDERERACCLRLLAQIGMDPAEFAVEIAAMRRPHSRRARERCRSLLHPADYEDCTR